MPEAAAPTVNYEFMGPSLLAKQQVLAPERPKKEMTNWGRVFEHLESRLGMLRSWRWSWWAYWSVLAQFFDPKRYLFFVVANRYWRGNPINDAIIDSTGLQALRICAAGMWSGLTNPSRPWVKLEPALPWIIADADAKAWFEDTLRRLFTVLDGSNFYDRMAQAFSDESLFGTAPVIVYEDFEDVIRLYLPCAGEYYLGASARLNTNTFYREFTYTVAELIEFAGQENCPQEVQKQWEEGGSSLEVEYVVAHAIEPNFRIAGRGRESKTDQFYFVPGKFAWREVYWLKGIKTPVPLSKRGFHEQPFFTLLWSQVQNDAYGRSPCMDALGDNKQVQLETKRKAEFIEKGVRPPMGADPQLKNEPQSIMPGQVTYFSTDGQKKGFFPLFEVQAQWANILKEDIAAVNARIQSCLFVDVFMAITRMEGVQPRNELELTKRDLERLQALGPVVNLAVGALKIAILRILSIMDRRRLLKPLPKSLQGVPLKIELVSMLLLAQRSAEAVAIKDTIATIGEMSEIAKSAGVPDPARTVKWDDTARKLGEVGGMPAELYWTPQQVLEHDQARQKATQQTMAPGNALAAVNAAKTLSETSLEPGNALSAMLPGAKQAA